MCDVEDKWVRVNIKKRDFPEGIYHHFSMDEKDMFHAMRLFIEWPV